MIIRRIVSEDIDSVRELARMQIHETYSEELFRYFFEDHPGCFLIAEEKGMLYDIVPDMSRSIRRIDE